MPLSIRTAWGPIVVAAMASSCATSGTLRPQPFRGAPTVKVTAVAPVPSLLVNEVLATAIGLIGRPYVFGAADPSTGFDCSGLVWYSFLQHRVALPRTTAELYEMGSPVGRGDVSAGDLVFFSTTSAGPSHVAIALDAQTLVHAPSTGTSVRVERFDTPYWQSRLIGVRRVDSRIAADTQADGR